jgi:hypothetical protein
MKETGSRCCRYGRLWHGHLKEKISHSLKSNSLKSNGPRPYLLSLISSSLVSFVISPVSPLVPSLLSSHHCLSLMSRMTVLSVMTMLLPLMTMLPLMALMTLSPLACCCWRGFIGLMLCCIPCCPCIIPGFMAELSMLAASMNGLGPPERTRGAKCSFQRYTIGSDLGFSYRCSAAAADAVVHSRIPFGFRTTFCGGKIEIANLRLKS